MIMGRRQLSGAALTAKMIKKRLAGLYPSVKFSVTSDVFSMGDSVDVRWTDGPLKDAIEAIAKEYQHGSFDGMTDSYDYSAIDASLGCSGSKYVQCHRSVSPGHKAMLEAKVQEHYGKMSPLDNSYHWRLMEIEKQFFPYQEPEQKTLIAESRGGADISGLEMEIIKDVDTRDNSEIHVVKVKTRVDDFYSLRRKMKLLGGYYSRYKNGFIFREDPTEKLGSTESTGADMREAS